MTTRRGQPAAQIHTGSFANQMWNRARATTAGAIWSATSTTMQEQWLGIDAKRWTWNAILDPKPVPFARPGPASLFLRRLSSTVFHRYTQIAGVLFYLYWAK